MFRLYKFLSLKLVSLRKYHHIMEKLCYKRKILFLNL
uniref:Uncharacterized protein n=1 Tax=Anguilla anguilla TaxID=7936 RepID=A0A0E9PAW6_ANGAN